MQESCTCGSVRGASDNRRPYRDTVSMKMRRNGFWNRGKCLRMKVDFFCGRVAQLGEHLPCKHEPWLQRSLPLLLLSNVPNNFGESASRPK